MLTCKDNTDTKNHNMQQSTEGCWKWTAGLPRTSLEIRTVKIGAELLMVSVKLTAMNFKETSPKTTVVNLQKIRKNY